MTDITTSLISTSAQTAHYTISKNTLLQHNPKFNSTGTNGKCVLAHYNLFPCSFNQSATCSSFSPYENQTYL